jgi:hypothetical protein
MLKKILQHLLLLKKENRYDTYYINCELKISPKVDFCALNAWGSKNYYKK